MEEKTKKSSNLNSFLWALIVVLVTAAIFANYYFGEVTWLIRFSIGVALVCCLAGLSFFTTQGRRFWFFIKDAKIELYKVVWPTRDETIKTTAVVAALVFVMSIVLWGVDTVLLKIVGWLTS